MRAWHPSDPPGRTQAQDYAIAHQISLVDLSGPEWTGLRDAAHDGAHEILESLPAWVPRFPIRLLRQEVRHALGTMPDDTPRVRDTEELSRILELPQAARRLRQHLEDAVDGALLAFPAGQQVLLARPDDLNEFLARAGREPEHQVTLAVAGSEVTLEPEPGLSDLSLMTLGHMPCG